jgi:hypothetical protein
MPCSTYIYDEDIPFFHGSLRYFLGCLRLRRNRLRSARCLLRGVTPSSGHRGSSVDRAFTHGLKEGGPCHGLFSGSIDMFGSCSRIFLWHECQMYASYSPLVKAFDTFLTLFSGSANQKANSIRVTSVFWMVELANRSYLK